MNVDPSLTLGTSAYRHAEPLHLWAEALCMVPPESAPLTIVCRQLDERRSRFASAFQELVHELQPALVHDLIHLLGLQPGPSNPPTAGDPCGRYAML